MSPPSATFGRRNLKPPPSSRAASSRSGAGFRAPGWLEAEPRSPSGEPLIVPTTLRGVLLAVVGVLCLEFGLLLARNAMGGVAGAALGPDAPVVLTPPMGLVVGLIAFVSTLAIGAAPVGAVYSLVAHAALRWLKVTSPLAYALGGAGVVYLLLAVWALNGYHLQARTSLIELAGGAIAGALYRLASGLAPAVEASGEEG